MALERWMDGPVGTLRLVAEDGALVAVSVEERRAAKAEGPTPGDPLLDEAVRQLGAWFRGERLDFELPLRPRGSAFQLAVWERLRCIPFGETRSYGEIAAALGSPRAVRAVGAANARNPLAIIVPCHRVIGASGALTGYAGGLGRKRWLLRHEREVLARSGRAPAPSGAQGCLPYPPAPARP